MITWIDELYLDRIDYKSLEDVISELDARMKLALDIHAPEITKTVVVWNRYLWYNEEIKEQRKVVRRRGKNLKMLQTRIQLESIQNRTLQI